MHTEMYGKFEKVISSDPTLASKIALAAPRGNAKSTATSLILPLWCICAQHRKFIGILSDTTEQANEFLEFIKTELEANERLREDFPEACGPGRTWKSGHIITVNGVKVRCWGTGKSLRGARHGSHRPDLVICDDLENDEHIDSPEQRRKTEDWFFKAVMKIGNRNTVYIVVGTILHYDSLLSKLLNRPGWTGSKYKAVIRFSTSSLWDQWEKIYSGREAALSRADEFFEKHRLEMLAGTEVLWPAVEDYYYLMKMRASDGPSAFDSEKQNEPINPSDCLFQEDWFQFWNDEVGSKPRSTDAVFCAVDPSMGKQSSDPSAILIGAVREGGGIDILEADIKRRHPDAIMEALFDYHEMYHLTRVVIEEVQFQELFKDQLINESAARKLYLPVEGTRPIANKLLRITKLQPHIRNGFIRFRRNQRTLLDQLKYYPKADHDDGPDALEMLFSLIKRGEGGPRIRLVA